MQKITEKLDEILYQSFAAEGIADFITMFVTIEPPFPDESEKFRKYMLQLPYIIQELCKSIVNNQKTIATTAEELLLITRKKDLDDLSN